MTDAKSSQDWASQVKTGSSDLPPLSTHRSQRFCHFLTGFLLLPNKAFFPQFSIRIASWIVLLLHWALLFFFPPSRTNSFIRKMYVYPSNAQIHVARCLDQLLRTYEWLDWALTPLLPPPAGHIHVMSSILQSSYSFQLLHPFLLKPGYEKPPPLPPIYQTKDREISSKPCGAGPVNSDPDSAPGSRGRPPPPPPANQTTSKAIVVWPLIYHPPGERRNTSPGIVSDSFFFFFFVFFFFFFFFAHI
ncbi:hypothetical protein L249_5069 [Ophiocordyceps polyrhachis-furcata BCC 54312]|uniref:Uncharacterized protein n=1 Tax=Ophiocordyceps polyrhachis-furcata BCC 54312 TaxID=1330021 RepID=A0A367L3S8_9HYPO|nr:hypothetical protein L249_5069 [Ophiocordyceps polyrhachis-furcata BCC 54312]